MNKETVIKVKDVMQQIKNSKTDEEKAQEIINLCADEAIEAVNDLQKIHIGDKQPDELTKRGLIAYQTWGDVRKAIKERMKG